MVERGNPGSFGFEGLLRGIGDLLHQAANISSDLKRNGAEGQQFQEGQKPRVESRMSVRTMDGDEIGADFFGLRELVATAQGRRDAVDAGEDVPPPPPERREVMVDILPEPDWIVAVAELPGANADSIRVTLEQDMLSVTGVGAGIDYAGEALLPCAVVDGQREQSFRNGVLELRWPRAGTKA